MELFLVLVCVAAGACTAVAYARNVIRCMPDSATGVVLGSIDDRVLAGGIAAGVAVTLCQELMEDSWLGWSWATPIVNMIGDTAKSAPPMIALLMAIPLLAATTLSPVIATVVVPAPTLALSAFFALLRGNSRPRPVITAAATAAATFTLGCPAAGSLCFGAATAAIGAVVRHATPVPDVAAALPNRLRLGDNDRSPRGAKQTWELLSPTGRYHAARISAVGTVTVMTTVFGTSAMALLSASLS